MRINTFTPSPRLSGASASPATHRPAASLLIAAQVPGRIDFDSVTLSSRPAGSPLALHARPADAHAAATRIVGAKLDVMG
jgi:hypothetical protein